VSGPLLGRIVAVVMALLPLICVAGVYLADLA
jgi:hypothetical protein